MGWAADACLSDAQGPQQQECSTCAHLAGALPLAGLRGVRCRRCAADLPHRAQGRQFHGDLLPGRHLVQHVQLLHRRRQQRAQECHCTGDARTALAHAVLSLFAAESWEG